MVYKIYEDEVLKMEEKLKYSDFNAFESILNDYEAKISDLRQKDYLKEEFILNISHDLRTHLNVVLSIMQLLKNKEYYTNNNENKWNEYSNSIKKSCYKMLKLINNLIDVTKLENNYFICNKENLEIVSFLENIVTSVDKYAKDKNISLIFDTNEEECIIGVDPEVIDRIVMNLLSNAIKFSPKSSEILITLDIDKNSVCISVRDQGPGIPEQEKQLVFNRFHKVNKLLTSEYEGSGIGLNLVNNLVKTHKGSIDIINHKDGCEFVVKFPREYCQECQTRKKISSNNKVEVLEIEFSDIY